MRIIIYLFIFLSFSSFSQELLTNLVSNSELKESTKIHFVKKIPSLDIPFIDDFSDQSIYPDSNLWQDNSVYINRNYGVNPITIGVATFDGLDFKGRPYDITLVGTDSEDADTLTSNRIDLSLIDTAFFMFFYQPQGIGNDPQISDSLILEFSLGEDSLGNMIWKKIWKESGSILYDFRKFVLVFSDTIYLRDDFQFRFRNLASVNGNFDHWNIDYVKLDKYQNSLDTAYINDVTFVRSNPMLLNRYREMPWVHFVNDVALEMRDSIDVVLRNNTDLIQSIDYRYDVFKGNNLVYHYPVLGGNNSTRNVDVPPYNNSGVYTFNTPPIILDDQMFPVNSADSAEFLFRNSIKTEPSDYKKNDTVSHIQRFYSHFAYDDGSAEAAYGINVQGAKLAYEFKLNRPDTLRMIQIKFVEMQDNLSDTKFAMTVWSNNNGLPGQILYRDTVEIQYKDRGEFKNYYLKEGVGLVGTFFIGWEQMTNDILNLGLDKNLIANNYMFYNIGGGWLNSQFSGSWMIRPVLNFNNPLISNSLEEEVVDFEIYPNPSHEKTVIYFDSRLERSFKLTDVMGRIIRSFTSLDNKINIYKRGLKSGIYFIQVTEGRKQKTKKIIFR